MYLLTVVAQLTALLKMWLSAHLFGIGPELDAYYLALVLPTFIAAIITSVLQTGLFPVQAKLITGGDFVTIVQFERTVMIGAAIVGAVISLAVMISAPALTNIIAASAPDSVRTLVHYSLPYAAILVFLNILVESAGYLLAMHNRFQLALAAPIVNGLFGAALLASWPEGQFTALVMSTLIGLMLQAIICLVGLRTIGFSWGRLPALIQIKDYWFEIITLGFPILPGVFCTNLIVSLPQLWIAYYGEGAVSAFAFAFRLHTTIVQLLIVSISPVVLAKFATLVVEHNHQRIRHLIKLSAYASITIGIIAVLVIGLWGQWSLKFIFGGRFDDLAASRVSLHWLWLTIGLPFTLLSTVFSKLFLAEKKSAMLSFFAGVSLLTLMMAACLLKKPMGELSIAISITVTSVLTLLLFLWGNNYFKN
ncbi:MAG: lipid II flippase MurJ [Legionella sp.]